MRLSIPILIAGFAIVGCARKPAPVINPGAHPVDTTIAVWVPEPDVATPLPYRNFYFDFDVDTLKPGQLRLLRQVSKAAHGRSLHVIGYADSVGGIVYNMALSTRRARAVALQLGATYEGRGEVTVYGVPARNRVAVITEE